MSSVKVDSVIKMFPAPGSGRIRALGPLSIEVEKSSICCIVGRSGCGKSTLLNLIAGLMQPSSGSIAVDGRRPVGGDRSVGYIKQVPPMLPYRRAFANAALGLELRRELTQNKAREIMAFLKIVGLEEFISNRPNELSQGMNQRIAFVRVMVMCPSLILADEPFSALDFDTRMRLEALFWEQCRELGSSCLFVTHHLDTAVSIGDRVVALTRQPGQLAGEIRFEDGFRMLPPEGRRVHPCFGQYQSMVYDLFADKDGAASAEAVS